VGPIDGIHINAGFAGDAPHPASNRCVCQNARRHESPGEAVARFTASQREISSTDGGFGFLGTTTTADPQPSMRRPGNQLLRRNGHYCTGALVSMDDRMTIYAQGCQIGNWVGPVLQISTESMGGGHCTSCGFIFIRGRRTMPHGCGIM
jgi:hypothetical protein